MSDRREERINSLGANTGVILELVNSTRQVSSRQEAARWFSIVESPHATPSYNGSTIGTASASGQVVEQNFVLGGHRKILPRGWVGSVSFTAAANSSSLATNVYIETSTDGVTWTTRVNATANGNYEYVESTPLSEALFLRFRLRSGSGGSVSENNCRFSNIKVTNLDLILFPSPATFSVDKVTRTTAGAATINAPSGKVRLAASATSLVVTNNLVTTSSYVIATVQSNDSTLKSVQCVPGAGSFTIYAGAAPTADADIAFLVIN